MNTKLEQASLLATKYEEILRPNGYHIALSGSTLYGGGGFKDDFDFHLYPHVGPEMSNLCFDDLIDLLPVKRSMEVMESKNNYPHEHVRLVRVCIDETGARVDFFFWNLNYDPKCP